MAFLAGSGVNGAKITVKNGLRPLKLICSVMDSVAIASLVLGLLLGAMTFLFIFRIVLTWYPQVDLARFPFNVIAVPTEPFLAPSRKIVPPLGGVDITPILWVGIFSLVREILLGQQGLLTMMQRGF